jgi:hypothetical protein
MKKLVIPPGFIDDTERYLGTGFALIGVGGPGLRMPSNCKIEPPDPGTVVGFVGAETFRKAIDRQRATSTRSCSAQRGA